MKHLQLLIGNYNFLSIFRQTSSNGVNKKFKVIVQSFFYLRFRIHYVGEWQHFLGKSYKEHLPVSSFI